LFNVKHAHVFFGPYLRMKVQLIVTNLQILNLGQKLVVTSLFVKQQHSSFQHNRQISGRLDKLWRLFFYYLLKFFHHGMDIFTSSTLVHFLTQSSMRWQLEISLVALVLILYKLRQVHWVVEGSGCIANISISSCKMWCIVAKHNLEVQCLMNHARLIIIE
jgi:hypothetical protein